VARDRIHACVRALDNIMRDERARGTECDAALFNRLLDARNLLAPSSALPLRPTTPVIPGRAS
jgi:hypothetical protein